MSIVSTNRTAHIEAQQPITLQSPLVQSVLSDLENFNSVAPLAFFRIELMEANRYEYELVTVDARHWLQSIDIPPQGEARLTFNVPNYWKLSEFSRQRTLRDAVISMVQTFGLTLFRVDYS